MLFHFLPALQAQTWHWAKQIGNADDDKFSYVRTDANGNAYALSYFTGSLTVGSTTLTSAGGTDILLAKYNSSGALQWAEKIGSTSSDYGHSLVFDSNNDVYVVGAAGTSAKFGSTVTLASGEYGAFIAKISSGGNWSWAKAANGGEFTSVALDANNDIYVGGNGPKSWKYGSFSLSNPMGFLLKMDASGALTWGREYTNNTSSNVNQGIHALETDGHGNVITAGHSQGIGGTVAGLYLSKYDGNGNKIWLKYSPGNQYDSKFLGIIYDKEFDKIYFAGLHPTNFSINFGDVNYGAKGQHGFVLKFDSSGKTEKLVMNADDFTAGSFKTFGMSKKLDGKQLYITGEFGVKLETKSGMTLEPQTGIFGFSRDVLILKIDTAGTIDQAAIKTGGNNEAGYGIDVLESGKAVVAGEFTTYQSYIAEFGSNKFTSAGKIDAFIASVTTEFIVRKVPISNWSYKQRGLKVWFANESEKNPTKWEWDFGDGTAKSSTQNPAHTYSKAGTYNVCLKAENADGNNTKCMQITVTDAVLDYKGVFAYGNTETLFIPSVGVSGSNVVAGATYGGSYEKIHRSGDNGNSWQLTSLSKKTNMIEKGPNGDLYIGSEVKIPNVNAYQPDSLYRSTDGGITWKSTGAKGIASAFSYDAKGNICGRGNAGTGSNLKISTDNGATFSDVYTGSAMTSGVAPNGNLLVGTYNSGIYYSTDGGANWTKSTNDIGNITIGPFYTVGNAVYTATYFGIYKSTDNGASFSVITPEPAITMTVSNFIVTQSGEFFVTSPLGFFYSDNGVKFTQVLGVPAFIDFAANNDYLFAAANDSIYRIALKKKPALTPPNAPGNLTAAEVKKKEDGKIKLEWEDNADNEAGFVLQRTMDTTATWVLVDSLAADIESYTDTGLTEGGKYYYRIYAYNAAGNSGFSNKAEGSISVGFNEWNTLISGWNIYPNPTANSNINLQITSTQNARISIEIRDLQGRLIYAENYRNLVAGNHTVQIHNSKIAKGIYSVNLICGNASVTKKLVVLE